MQTDTCRPKQKAVVDIVVEKYVYTELNSFIVEMKFVRDTEMTVVKRDEHVFYLLKRPIINIPDNGYRIKVLQNLKYGYSLIYA